jgi:cytochrome oxidase Cu insertion factor (SCO1/SenC/PrrC family)
LSYLVNGNTNNFTKETTMMKQALGFMAVLALLAASAFAQEAPKPPAPPAIKTHLKVGDKAPDFKLTGVDGKVVQLKKLKGKSNVVLAFYPKAFTGG